MAENSGDRSNLDTPSIPPPFTPDDSPHSSEISPPLLNGNPEWVMNGIRVAQRFLESRGWWILLALVTWHFVSPYVSRAVHYLTDQKQDHLREAELERRRRLLVSKKEEEVERAKQEWIAKKLAQEDELRKKTILELDKKAARLGLRPRGIGQKLGVGEFGVD